MWTFSICLKSNLQGIFGKALTDIAGIQRTFFIFIFLNWLKTKKNVTRRPHHVPIHTFLLFRHDRLYSVWRKFPR